MLLFCCCFVSMTELSELWASSSFPPTSSFPPCSVASLIGWNEELPGMRYAFWSPSYNTTCNIENKHVCMYNDIKQAFIMCYYIIHSIIQIYTYLKFTYMHMYHCIFALKYMSIVYTHMCKCAYQST